ncbi:MAG: GTPase HflX, partial [Ignavibacteria bacterium]|nr:GTPase HflX [Ignavibacteria bacterium]
TDRRIIRTRISKLKENLKRIEAQQITKSSSRKNFVNATLVGYTNAGKSTLLNLLTNAGVLAEDKLFATLDSTTRSFELDKNKKVLLSDTVGFIRKLPHNLVASFKTTLNVVKDADIILHVIDASHEFYDDQIKVVEETLKELSSSNKKQIKIFNKIDLLKDRHIIETLSNHYPDSIFISAARGIGISKLIESLSNIFEQNFTPRQVKVKHANSKIISKIYELAEVINAEYDDDFVILDYRANSTIHNQIKKLISNK